MTRTLSRSAAMVALLAAVLASSLNAQATGDLMWGGGRLIFDPWVRVDDASGLSGHPAIHPQMVMDTKARPRLYTVWQDDRNNDGAGDIYFARSVDLGLSWSRPCLRISDSTGSDDVYPWIAIDSEDTNNVGVYVVWQATLGSNSWSVRLARSLDGGQSFLAPVAAPGITVVNDLSSGINFGPQPKIAVDWKSNPDTTYIYLLWADNGTGVIQVRLARSIDDGATFQDLGIVDKNPTNVNRNPYILVDDDGVVHCAWARGTGGTNNDPHPNIGYNYSTNHGVTFQSQDIIVNDDLSGVFRGNPTIAVNNANGNVLVAWEDSRRASGNANPDIWFSRMPRYGTAFSANERVNLWATDTNATYDNFRPAISMDPQGTMVASWHDDPEADSRFGLHLSAYADTAAHFGYAQSLFNTYTGTTGANFGNAFYPPSLYVTLVDSAPNFFIVWQDFSEDATGGNIYSVRGRVIFTWADLDVYNDSLDVQNNILNFGAHPAGPPNHLKTFAIVNADSAHNPDNDGYSVDTLITNLAADSVTLYLANSTYRFNCRVGCPSLLRIGQPAVCTVDVELPDTALPGFYTGNIVMRGIGSMHGDTVYDNFTVRIQCKAADDLKNVKVFPNPCRMYQGMEHVYFYNIPANCKVRIYDAAGDRVKGFREEIQNGLAIWQAPTAGGLYYYVIADPKGRTKKGRIAIIR